MTIPGSTYRIQFNKQFTFKKFNQILDYLHQLGISTVYASPILQAAPGSEHCYDVTDPHNINPEIGTKDELAAIRRKMKKYGMNWLQDLVPNHMAFSNDNYRLMDVLERGINSSFALYFDIDWNHPQCRGKLMVPFLDGDIEKLLGEKKVTLSYNAAGFFLKYYDNYYPINIESYKYVLSELFPAARKYFVEMLFRLGEPASRPYQEWRAAKTAIMQQLLLFHEKFIAAGIEKINVDQELLKTIVDGQHYILCDYHEANNKINYRRFFNINSLICLRMEEEKVFLDYHQYIYELYKKGFIQGLRIDHIDGLKDPAVYIKRLRSLFGKDCYIIAEKILDIKEDMPGVLGVEGTSGYEFLSYINQVVTDMKGSAQLTAFYNSMVPEYSNYEELIFQKKLYFLKTRMQGEWNNLNNLLSESKLLPADAPQEENIKEALAVFMASFPVYRTYTNRFPLDDASSKYISNAFSDARRRAPNLADAFDALTKIFEPGIGVAQVSFIQRLMQFTGPLAAKGVEDTTFYVYNPLISHNEVGDEPCVLGIPIETFHRKMQQRLQSNPFSLNCTSTHDTKRGEDARMRINTLSEIPATWIKTVEEWQAINKEHKTSISGTTVPSVNEEYLLYQSLIGSISQNLQVDESYISRTKNFFTKALREAKTNSSHMAPDADYEAACSNFIEAILNDQRFTQSLTTFMQNILPYAAVYSLAQVVIKSTAPGIPDFYQGCELWDLSYVDPDNRVAVNFDERKKMLGQLQHQGSTAKALSFAEKHMQEGAQKMFVTSLLLHYRKDHPALFEEGEYIPVYAKGGERLMLAYAKKQGNHCILIVLPLNVSCSKSKIFKQLQLQLPANLPSKWKNIFTHETIHSNTATQVHTLFKKFPVAVFESVE